MGYIHVHIQQAYLSLILYNMKTQDHLLYGTTAEQEITLQTLHSVKTNKNMASHSVKSHTKNRVGHTGSLRQYSHYLKVAHISNVTYHTMT